MVIVAFVLPVLLLVAALLIDVTGAFVHKRSLQNRADAVSLAASQSIDHTTGLCVGPCVTVLNAYNKKNDPTAADLVPCLTDGQSNCYEAPYVDGGGTPHIGQIEVRLKDEYVLALGGAVGLNNPDVSARAVSGVTQHFNTNVQTIPGSTNTVTLPAITNVTTTPGTPAVPGNPALFFAKSTSCNALQIVGKDNVFNGAVVSSGGISVHDANTGNLLIYGTGQPSRCVDVGSGWAKVKERPAVDWPVPNPVCLPAPGCTDAQNNTITSVGGRPCTAKPANWSVPSGGLPPGLYCSSSQIRISTTNQNYAGVGFVAPTISVNQSGNTFTGYAGLLSQYGGLTFYAYGKGGFDDSGAGNTFGGAILAPFGNAHINGAAGQVITGYVQADTVQINAAGGVWTGLGPDFEGTPATPPTTVTTTTPGQVITSTTPQQILTTTTEGPPTYGLDE